MIIWILYFVIENNNTIDYPYHFAFRETCEKFGKDNKKIFKAAKYRCVKEIIESQ